MTNIIFIGPESSGNRWVLSILRLHPEINIEFAGSFPKFLYHKRQYPDLEEFNAEKNVLIVMGRDRNITQISADRYNRNDNVRNPERFSFDKTIENIQYYINNWRGKVIFMSYELLLLWQNLYLKKIFEQIGVSTNFDCSQIKYIDGNKKYIKDTIND